MSADRKGFTPPNYTQVPNTLFDLLDSMSNAELRVTLVLCRQTYGWHRQRTPQMPVAEVAHLAGLSESSAKTGIKEGTQRGTIKRYKARDEMNRPSYRYSLVVTEDAPREVFERPRSKSQENAEQNAPKPYSIGQNLTGLDFDWVKFQPGQKLPPCPVNSIGQNLTGSYKEEINLLEEKKVVAIDVVGDAREATLERDDEGAQEEQDSARLEALRVFGVQPADLPDEEPHAENLTDPVQEGDLEGGDMGDKATGLEDIPAARDEIHETQPWDPAEVDAQLDTLTNRRWLKAWTSRNHVGPQLPLVEEVDGTGVDRHEIARRISPERLAELVRMVRTERARLEAESRLDRSVTVPSFQHLLIQELQSQVLRLDNLRVMVAAAAAESHEEARPLDDDGEPLPPAPPTLQRLGQRREWQVGDQVSYKLDVYDIVEITGHKILLDSENCGSVGILRSSDDVKALRLIAPAKAMGVSA